MKIDAFVKAYIEIGTIIRTNNRVKYVNKSKCTRIKLVFESPHPVMFKLPSFWSRVFRFIKTEASIRSSFLRAQLLVC